jgi:two-component system, chemotaxis family, chemotaxis protein CheY
MNAIKDVLIVDDSAQMHFLYKMILTRYTCNVIDALNGQEAFYLLSQNPRVGLIILDINMPLMNGLEFIRMVKQREEYSGIPIIIASTAGREEETRQGLALGAQASVKKPFSSGELRELIERIYPSAGKNRRPVMNGFQGRRNEYSASVSGMLVRKKRLMRLSRDIY